MVEDTDGHPERVVDLAHPHRIAAGEGVVDGDDMDALPFERIQIGRKRRNKGLTLAGTHLRDVSLVQYHAADKLDVEMALPERAAGRFPHGGKSLRSEIIQGGSLGEPRAEFGGLLL